MNTPGWVLTLSLWIHLIATISWMGGLAIVSFWLLPKAEGAMDTSGYARFSKAVLKRLDALGWLSLMLLAATGMFQMSANPNYGGFLAIDNLWASTILIKHILFFLILAINAAHTWSLTPALERATLRKNKGLDESGEAEKLQKRANALMAINLLLGIGVLLLTVMAQNSA